MSIPMANGSSYGEGKSVVPGSHQRSSPPARPRLVGEHDADIIYVLVFAGREKGGGSRSRGGDTYLVARLEISNAAQSLQGR